MEELKKVKIDKILDDGTIFVEIITYTIQGGLEVPINMPHREQITPLEFDKAKSILPNDLFTKIQNIWTPKVIEAYQIKEELNEQLTNETVNPAPTETELLAAELSLALAEIQLNMDMAIAELSMAIAEK